MSDKQWRFDAPEPGDVTQAKFDPISLGFTKYISRRYLGNTSVLDKDYLILANSKGGNGDARISLCEDTADFVTSMFGDRCDIYINEKGQLLITAGESLKISKQKSRNGRRSISIGGLRDRLIECYGKFYRLFLTAKVYAHGNAILLVSNGERV